MTYIARYSKAARVFLLRLEKRTKQQVVKKIGYYCESGKPLSFAKPLSGRFQGCYRFRIGEYRAIFRVEPTGAITVLYILEIGNRRDIYSAD